MKTIFGGITSCLSEHFVFNLDLVAQETQSHHSFRGAYGVRVGHLEEVFNVIGNFLWLTVHSNGLPLLLSSCFRPVVYPSTVILLEVGGYLLDFHLCPKWVIFISFAFKLAHLLALSCK